MRRQFVIESAKVTLGDFRAALKDLDRFPDTAVLDGWKPNGTNALRKLTISETGEAVPDNGETVEAATVADKAR